MNRKQRQARELDVVRMMGAGAMGGGTAVPLWQVYADSLINNYGADEVWPLVDIESGTIITARANTNRNGVLAGWALQNAAGPVSGSLAPYADATDDKGDILTNNGLDGLVDIFNGSEGSLFGWLQAANAAVWTDGSFRTALQLKADASNYILIRKQSTNNLFTFFYDAGGTIETHNHTLSSTDWFSFGLSWSKSNDQAKSFINGGDKVTTTGLGNWAGALTLGIIGANSLTPDFMWKGWYGFYAVRFGTVWSDTDFANIHALAANPT